MSNLPAMMVSQSVTVVSSGTDTPLIPVLFFSDVEGLGEITLQLPCSLDDQTILRGKFLDPEHRDDVLKLSVPRDVFSHGLRDGVVPVSQEVAVHEFAFGLQSVDRRINSFGRLGARKNHRRVEMAQNAADRRVRHVVGGNIHRLHGRHGIALSRENALLQFRNFGHERWLIANGCGHSAEEPRNLAARLDETVDVVHDEQNFVMKRVPQVFRISESRKPNAETHAGRFVHLSENEKGLGHHSDGLHFVPEFVGFANALADAREDRYAPMKLGDGMHELHDQNRLAHAGAAKEAGLSPPDERAHQINHLDPCFQNFAFGG